MLNLLLSLVVLTIIIICIIFTFLRSLYQGTTQEYIKAIWKEIISIIKFRR